MKSLIKYIVLCLLSAAVGIGAAWVYQKYEAGTTDENFYSNQWDTGLAQKPILYVNGGLRVDLGTVLAGETTTHEFLFENQGTERLEIWLKEQPEDFVTTDVTEEKLSIVPGGTYPVAVTIDPSKATVESGKPIVAKLQIGTNDPDNEIAKLQVTATPDSQ